MAAISKKLNVIVTASTAAFHSGMQKALGPLNAFKSGVNSLGSSLTSFKGMIAAAGAAAAVAGFTSLVKGQMEAIDSTAKLSDRLGISTEALVGLQHAGELAGVSSDELTGAFEKMNKSIGEAAMSGGPAEASLARLGLSAKQLVNQSPDEAFKQIADGLVGIQNPAERAVVAMDIFGKSGQSLLPLMLSGSEGIKAAQEEAAKLGLTFSRMDAAKVEAANDAITKVQGALAGAARTLAVQLAPFIEAIANKLTGLATSGEGMGQRVINAFEWVVTAVAKAADYLELVRMGFHAIRGVAAMSLGGLVQLLGLVIQGVEWLAEKLGATNNHFGEFTRQVGEEMVGVAQESFKAAGESWETFASGANSKAATEMFRQIRNDADAAAKKIADNAQNINGAAAATEDWAKQFETAKKNAEDVAKTLDDIRLKREQAGMTDAQKQLDDLKRKGATPEQLAQAQNDLAATDQIKTAQEQAKKLQDAAKGIFEATRTPMEKFEAKAEELYQMFNEGLIDEATFSRASEAALKELNEADKKEIGNPSLILKNSAESQRLIYESSRGFRSMSQDKQLETARKANQILERIERNTKGPSYEVVEIGQ